MVKLSAKNLPKPAFIWVFSTLVRSCQEVKKITRRDYLWSKQEVLLKLLKNRQDLKMTDQVFLLCPQFPDLFSHLTLSKSHNLNVSLVTPQNQKWDYNNNTHFNSVISARVHANILKENKHTYVIIESE